MVDAFVLAERAQGQRLDLPDFFSAPVLVEAATAQTDDIVFLRVRTSASDIVEVPVAADVIERALRLTTDTDHRIAKPEDLFLRIESTRIRLAFAYDPYFAVSLSGIDALPHQLEAVYER